MVNGKIGGANGTMFGRYDCSFVIRDIDDLNFSLNHFSEEGPLGFQAPSLRPKFDSFEKEDGPIRCSTRRQSLEYMQTIFW
jgi:hypothetical protein